MKILKTIIAFIITGMLIQGTTAQVQIKQIYPDPIITESGGEAVELENTAEETADISNWVLATKASSTDVVIPINTVIPPLSTFLIADEGWSTKKDNAQWRNADIEETMTLGNTDAGIILKNANGTVINTAGWGSATTIGEEFYSITPTTQAQTGKAFKRITNTGNNSKDFIITEPDFKQSYTSGKLTIHVNAQEEENSITILEDDDTIAGTQILPTPGTTRNIPIIFTTNNNQTTANITAFGISTQLTKTNNTFKGNITLQYTTMLGEYNITATSGNNIYTNSITILPIIAEQLDTQDVYITTKETTISINGDNDMTTLHAPTLKNIGNVPFRIALSTNAVNTLRFTTNNEQLSIANKLAVSNTLIQPGETSAINFQLITTATKNVSITLLAVGE